MPSGYYVYVTAPALARGTRRTRGAFSFSAASWYFLDEVDMRDEANPAKVIVAFGD
jgi:hypothetical protein